MQPFDIAPSALGNHPPGELCFEEPRDISRVVVTFRGRAPRRVGVSYLRRLWPQTRVEQSLYHATHRPGAFGWAGIDDLFNTAWQRAVVRTERLDEHTVAVTFKGITVEFPDLAGLEGYNVTYRRTMGIRVDAPKTAVVHKVQVLTASEPAVTRLRVELDAGRKTRGSAMRLSGYNAVIGKIERGPGATPYGKRVELGSANRRVFRVTVRHMSPAHQWSFDDALVTFALGHETFTISLTGLQREGPVWYADQGVYVASADDPTGYRDYRKRVKGARTVAQQVAALREQSLGGAMHGQPRPHPDAFILGCKGVREHFWIEPNGDVVVQAFPLKRWPSERTARFLNKGHARFFFALARWCPAGRFNDPPPIMAYNVHVKRDEVMLEQKSLAAPLEGSMLDGELAGDATLVGMVRFRFTNVGDHTARAELPVGYSSDSGRTRCPLVPAGSRDSGQSDDNVPLSARDELTARGGRLTSRWDGRPVLRAAYATTMTPSRHGTDVCFRQELKPGQTCELLLKIPYISLETTRERKALNALRFDACHDQVSAYWRREGRRGARVHTPEPNLDAAYALHWPIVMISDPLMPDGRLINTSVGTGTYGNFCNESCMIQQELDQRGLHEEARRRLDVYVKYQGTSPMAGNFTDFDGVYFGTGGFDGGSSYVQNHGWVMWRLAEHYFMTGDDAWLRSVADSLLAAADWVFRQRANTMKKLPHSRGWEYGFLPAGGLEDVTDFHYWQNNNVMAWCGTEWTARALAAIGHPEAARVRRESDAYRADLLRGLETARCHSPLVRLRDGRWAPHYPTRLYRRGRDVGWIRETLEGAVYLMLSGLYDPAGKQAAWILDDYHDNRYMTPPHGYTMEDPETGWFSRGGFSIQPNLLAGLLPHLDRDEPEVYIWMFFNAWAACYREEANAMVEHPLPVLGFSNVCPFKTSDQSNAMKWLVYMYVYAKGETLHFGRAIPRDWLRDGSEIWAEDVGTLFGRCGVKYTSESALGRITARVALDLRRAPAKTLVRFRHPEGRPIRSVTVNGRAHKAFDAARGDVDISGLKGTARVIASY